MSHVLQQLMNKYKKNTTIQYNTKVYYIKYTYTALQANTHIYNLWKHDFQRNVINIVHVNEIQTQSIFTTKIIHVAVQIHVNK